MKKRLSGGSEAPDGVELGRSECFGGGEGVRVLLAVAARHAGEELERELASGGYRVTWVRNRYTAIDVLRAEHHDIVVSDFELWEDGGELLFERMCRRGEVLPVIFLGGPAGRSERHLREDGETVRCIPRPFTGEDLRTATRSLLRPEGRGGTERRPGASKGMDVGPAARWRLFFSETRRRLCAREGRAERLGELVACFREVVQPLAAMVAVSSPTGHRVILGMADTDGSLHDSSEARPWGELFEALLKVEASPETLRVTLPAGTSRRLSFLARLRDGEAKHLTEDLTLDPFQKELRALLAEAFRGKGTD